MDDLPLAIDKEAKHEGDDSGQCIGLDKHVSDAMRMEKARERRLNYCSTEERDDEVEKPKQRVPNACSHLRHGRSIVFDGRGHNHLSVLFEC